MGTAHCFGRLATALENGEVELGHFKLSCVAAPVGR